MKKAMAMALTMALAVAGRDRNHSPRFGWTAAGWKSAGEALQLLLDRAIDLMSIEYSDDPLGLHSRRDIRAASVLSFRQAYEHFLAAALVTEAEIQDADALLANSIEYFARHPPPGHPPPE